MACFRYLSQINLLPLSFTNSQPHHCTLYQSSPIGPPTLKPTPGPTNVPTLEPTFYPTWSPTITGEYFLHQWCVLFCVLINRFCQLTCLHVILFLAARPTDKPIIDPNDPSFTFYCGKSWAEADEKCPIRCPSGGSEECPA